MSIIGGYVLDLFLGDPQWRWHPVRFLGRTIEKLEGKLNIDKFNKIIAGTILLILVVGVTVSCVWVILRLTRAIHTFFFFIVSTISIYFVLSVKALAVEARDVKRALEHKDIQMARQNLSMIVGRDTDKLGESEMVRATVETVAESIMDGIVGPLFYVFLGGPALAWAYKAINTLDSMVGYRSERYIRFGMPSAKLDALVNYIPARITCLLIGIASWPLRKDWFSSFRCGLRYFFKGPAKNSEATEAAMAGALGIRLGGPCKYEGKLFNKPYLGENKMSVGPSSINEALKISFIVSFLMILMGVLLKCVLK